VNVGCGGGIVVPPSCDCGGVPGALDPPSYEPVAAVASTTQHPRWRRRGRGSMVTPTPHPNDGMALLGGGNATLMVHNTNQPARSGQSWSNFVYMVQLGVILMYCFEKM